LNESDYQDESQSEGDIDVLIDDLIGYQRKSTMPQGVLNEQSDRLLRGVNESFVSRDRDAIDSEQAT